MKIIVPCVECALQSKGQAMFSRQVHVQDDRVYRVTCPAGHSVVGVLEHQDFELLFESGLDAFADGYFRESVSSFAAALERMYEFSTRVILSSSGAGGDAVDAMWKLVGGQSERQLGLYIGIKTMKQGSPPAVLDEKQVKFRNKVIHKGYFPSSSEAFEFGKAVYTLITDEVRDLDAQYPEQVEGRKNEVRRSAWSGLKKGELPTSFGFGLAVANRAPLPFLDLVNAKATRAAQQRSGAAPTFEVADSDQLGTGSKSAEDKS